MAVPSRHPAFYLVLLISALFLKLASVLALDVEQDDRGVYRIINLELKGGVSTGSGFLVNSSGLVVTNNHVVNGARTLLVVHREPTIIKVWVARLIGVSGARDLALLQAEGINGTPLALNKDGATKGSDVYAFGFPGQADTGGEAAAFIQALASSHFHDVPLNDQYDNFVRSSVKKGNVEDVRMRLWGYPGPQGKIQVVQHSASFTGGNSGGPLIDNEDRVVGINTIVQGENAVKDGSGEKILLGNLLRFSSSSTELINFLDSLHLGYATQPLHTTSSPTPTPSPTVAPTPTPMPSVALVPSPTARVVPMKTPVAIGSPAQDDRPSDGSRYLWAGGILLAVAAVGGILLFVLLRGRSKPVVNIPPPFPPPVPRPQEPDLRWLLSGQDTAGRPYQLVFETEMFARHKGALLLGRSASQADLRIDHDSLSRVHAELRCRKDRLFIVDKGSANGTKVNGRVLLSESDEASLHPGDLLHLGEVTLVLGLDRPN